MALTKSERRQRVHYRIRKVVNGTPERPRMVVFRSNKQIYVQVVDDTKGITLVSASSNDKVLAEQCKGKNGCEAAAIVFSFLDFTYLGGTHTTFFSGTFV